MPDLRTYCEGVARTKKREFREQTYWGKPVPGVGDPKARLWIMGLAPAAHGANRTGRMFTGDSSGLWLYRALHHVGLSSQAESTGRDDGLVLRNTFISSAARCAPPDNKPLPSEIQKCSAFLDREFEILSNIRLFVGLGAVGFNAVLQLLERRGITLPRPRPKFSHGAEFEVGKYRVLASYHPSRQNTNTGKLTLKMWNEIFLRAAEIIK